MNVNPRDGCCRSCGGMLTIVDADDATMTVECDCSEEYSVETAAFGDGCMTYNVDFTGWRMKDDASKPDVDGE